MSPKIIPTQIGIIFLAARDALTRHIYAELATGS